jgi:hypothetical protein
LKFAKDLRAGRRGEDSLLEILAGAGLEAGRNPARGRKGRAGYDVWAELPGGRRLFEVKHDLWEARSGNVAVEYANPRAGRPSGIAATEADAWVFVLADGSAWACRVRDLRRHHGKGRGGAGFVRDLAVCGDDNSSSYLYRRKELFGILFFELTGLEPDELVALLEVLTERMVPELC